MAEKCTKLIFALSKSAKLNWRVKTLSPEDNIEGGILPVLLYGAPVWIKGIEKGSYQSKLILVQRIINIKIAKACRTVSNKALCILTGLTSIALKIEKAAQFYQLTIGSTKEEAQTDLT